MHRQACRSPGQGQSHLPLTPRSYPRFGHAELTPACAQRWWPPAAGGRTCASSSPRWCSSRCSSSCRGLSTRRSTATATGSALPVAAPASLLCCACCAASAVVPPSSRTRVTGSLVSAVRLRVPGVLRCRPRRDRRDRLQKSDRRGAVLAGHLFRPLHAAQPQQLRPAVFRRTQHRFLCGRAAQRVARPAAGARGAGFD